MHPCLAITVFVFVSSVACLDGYSFDSEFRPALEERNIMLKNEQPSSLESLANDQYLYDSSSKEVLDDDLGNPSHSDKYVSLWATGGGKNMRGDSSLLESTDVIQELQNIQENSGFPPFGSREYLNRPHIRPSKRGSVDLNEQNEEYLMNPEEKLKSKRSGHSLSIVNPLDVLRQRMLLDMARQRMAKNQAQIQINDSILRELGKRNHNFTSSSSFSFARRGHLSPGEKSAQRRRRQSRDRTSGKQVPAFEQLEV